jgi:type IV pilus assembly protein PilX
MKTLTQNSLRHQHGVVLIVALLFLVVLTILGTAASRMVTSEERMSRFAREYNIAFQAAEAALRDARDELNPLLLGDVMGGQNNRLIDSIFTPDCQLGLCRYDKNATPWKEAANWDRAVPYGTYSSRSPLPRSAVVGKDASKALEDSGSTTDRYGENKTDLAKTSGVFDQPKYLIESVRYQPPFVDTGFGRKAPPQIYRVTALGVGADPNTRAMVQEVFLPPVKAE